MPVIKMKVTYNDGREVEVIASPRAQVMTEEYLGGWSNERRIVGDYYLAWCSLNKAGKETHDFETFLDQIADAETVETKKADDPDPTEPVQPGDTSSG
jgi:hypothetical protein